MSETRAIEIPIEDVELLKAINHRKPKGLNKDIHEFTQNEIDCMCVDIASGLANVHVIKKYKIGYRRLFKIQKLYQNQIDRIRQEFNLERDKRILNLANETREKILSNITQKDINKANLKSKTASLVDLTQIKRLESGQSTANIGVDLTAMTKEQIENYLKSGNNDVNNNDTTIDVLDTTTEQINLNEPNHQKEQID